MAHARAQMMTRCRHRLSPRRSAAGASRRTGSHGDAMSDNGNEGKNTLSIRDNRTGRDYEIDILDGDVISAMDLRQIKVEDTDFGMMSYDPAFTNTASTRSTVGATAPSPTRTAVHTPSSSVRLTPQPTTAISISVRGIMRR